jgi:mono/diheme cytochrome c family protein
VRQLTGARLVCAAAAVWAVCVTCVVAGQAQAPQTAQPPQPPQTIWSGVYSEAQAYRGEKVAETSCIGCHGSGLSGGDSGPKLVGDMFLANWSSQSVAQLFGYVSESMPADAPGTLKKEEAAAVLAYILKINNMPAGKKDLSSDSDELSRIEIVTLAEK